MRMVTYSINYGGFIGAEETYSVYVDEDATQDDIECAVEDDFQNKISENCSWEIVDVTED